MTLLLNNTLLLNLHLRFDLADAIHKAFPLGLSVEDTPEARAYAARVLAASNIEDEEFTRAINLLSYTEPSDTRGRKLRELRTELEIAKECAFNLMCVQCADAEKAHGERMRELNHRSIPTSNNTVYEQEVSISFSLRNADVKVFELQHEVNIHPFKQKYRKGVCELFLDRLFDNQ